MTRINVIPPHRLLDEHLRAEYRELPRVSNLARALPKGSAPSGYVLGAGHVKFFYDKLGYLLERYGLLHEECLKRGFKVTDYRSAWRGVPPSMMGSYCPTENDVRLIRDRIRERNRAIYRREKPNPRHHIGGPL